MSAPKGKDEKLKEGTSREVPLTCDVEAEMLALWNRWSEAGVTVKEASEVLLGVITNMCVRRPDPDGFAHLLCRSLLKAVHDETCNNPHCRSVASIRATQNGGTVEPRMTGLKAARERN